MPQKSKLKLPPLDLGKETLGERLSRLRKEKGYTQDELASKMGIVRVLISDYERERIRPHYEMVIRYALALGVTTDELLGLKKSKALTKKPSLKILRRLNKIEQLPPSKRRTLMQIIDGFIKGVEA
jgi:transcriptional regulator with XRE-family HTH domain